MAGVAGNGQQVESKIGHGGAMRGSRKSYSSFEREGDGGAGV